MAAGGLRSQDWPAQLEGIERKLRASKAGWKIVVGHHPPRSNGHHGNTIELLEALEPILQVDLRSCCTQAFIPALPATHPSWFASTQPQYAAQATVPLVSLSRM